MHELGRELMEAGLNEPALVALFGAAWSGEDVPLVLDRYRAGDRRVPLVRAFVLGEPVASESLPVDAERLAGAGLVELEGGCAVARVRLTPFAGLLAAHDADFSAAHAVTGAGSSSRTLATLTVRREIERALDVGTGCGVQALLAAEHAQTVVATDVNPRALEYTALGARLNGRTLDLRQGSLYEPVDGEQFDLVVANPPFVISPDADFVYRDGPLPGDGICREFVRGAAAHLRPGGFATVLCNWICRDAGQSWEPLVSWVEGLDCDALLLSHGAIEPLHYASRWNQRLRNEPEAYARAIGRWLDYYEEEGISAIGVGAVVLRGRESPGWTRGFTAPRPATGAAGGHILRLFAAADRLAGLHDDRELLDERLALVRGHRLDQSLAFGDEYRVAGVTMSLVEGTGLVAEIEPELLPLLFELSPATTVAEAAAAAELDPAEVAPAVRRLLEHGLLELRPGT
jgi:methylase of polypeptide subunit release factors